MKIFGILSLLLIAVTSIAASDVADTTVPNEVVRFLEGEWWNVDITVSKEGDITLNEYREKMTVKDHQTLTVTAFEIREGVDVTKDITVRIDGDSVVLAQEGFEARGIKTGNRLILEGKHGAYRIEFRLYLMGDAYIYQKDVWLDGEIVQSQMSYLQRVNTRGN